MAVAFHFPQSRFNIQERAGKPVLHLVRVALTADPPRPGGGGGIDGLEAVRGLEGGL